MIIFKVWGSETSAMIVKILPTNTGQSSLIADVVSPARILEHRRSRRSMSGLSFSTIDRAKFRF
jgi:hypothetical protein